MPRVSSIDRAIPGTPLRPVEWSGAYVRTRLIEACEIEKRLPQPGPRRNGSAWVPMLYEFADVVGWTDARERVWDRWERARGAMPFEVSRMDEAFRWLRELAPVQPGEARCLAFWALAMAHGLSLQRLLRKRGWAETTFRRKVVSGSERIAARLVASGAPVR